MASRKSSYKVFEDGEEIQVTYFWYPWPNMCLTRHVESVGSTNQALLETQDQFGTHVTAKTQTTGRGRYQRTWFRAHLVRILARGFFIRIVN